MNLRTKLFCQIILNCIMICLFSGEVASQIQPPDIANGPLTPAPAVPDTLVPAPALAPVAPGLVPADQAAVQQPIQALTPVAPDTGAQAQAPAPIAPAAPLAPVAVMPAAPPPAPEQLVTAVPGLGGVPMLAGAGAGQQQAIPAQPTAPPVNLIEEGQEAIKEGIDTIAEEDSGNWYEKRRAWKKARPKYDEIRKLVADVDATEKELFDKDKEFEKNLESFYLSIGLQQGEVTQILDTLIQELEKEKAKKAASNGQVNTQEKQLAEIQAKKQKDLEALKNNIDKIKKISSNVHDSILTTFVDQVKLAKLFEDKALESYYRISEILDDRKARNLLHDMDTYSENVQAILAWIQGELKSYVDQSLSKSQELIDATKKQIEELKQQGIVLQKKLSEQEKKAQEEKLKKEAEEKAKAEAERRAKLSFWGKIKQFFSTLFSSIGNFFSSLWHSIKNSFSFLTSSPKGAQPKQVPVAHGQAPAAPVQDGAGPVSGTPGSLAESIPQAQKEETSASHA